jgi:hypothetical protein
MHVDLGGDDVGEHLATVADHRGSGFVTGGFKTE